MSKQDKLGQLQQENFHLAANQCIVENGLLGDDGGTPYCVLQEENAVLKRDLGIEKRVNQAIVDRSDGLINRVHRAEDTLRQAGYTDHGGQLWKPPLGKNASPLLDRISELKKELAKRPRNLMEHPIFRAFAVLVFVETIIIVKLALYVGAHWSPH